MDETLRRLSCLAPLQGFEAAARHLSFTRAAAELCLTQSAISRQVQTLETQLGVPLFVRQARSLALTPEGGLLLATVQRVLRELATALAELRTAEQRPVTVSASVGFAALWLVPRLSGFLAAHPEIDVRISAVNRLVDVEREGIDLALRYVPSEQAPPGSLRLAGEEIFPVASPALLGDLAHRPPQAADLARLTLLCYDDANPLPWLDWPRWLQELGLAEARPKAVLHFNQYDQTIAAAAAGQGVALGRGVLVARLQAEGWLQPMACGRRPLSDRGYYLVESGSPRPEVGLLRDWIRSEFDAPG